MAEATDGSGTGDAREMNAALDEGLADLKAGNPAKLLETVRKMRTSLDLMRKGEAPALDADELQEVFRRLQGAVTLVQAVPSGAAEAEPIKEPETDEEAAARLEAEIASMIGEMQQGG